MARYVVVGQAPAGPTIVAAITFTVTDPASGDTQVLAVGASALDVHMASLMPAGEYAARHLWPAFCEAAAAAKVTIPGFRPPPTGIIRGS